MPVAGRGEPLSKTTKYNWTDDEYSTLNIIEVEHPYLNGSDKTRLWHKRFPEHMKQGREYNASKLKETWQFRHYTGKSVKWKTIARPNRRPGGDDQTPHSAQEQAKIQALRQELQAAANSCTPPIALQVPTARVDSGVMCDCNACQGVVQTRSNPATHNDAAKDKKGKARGISAKSGSGRGVSKKISKVSARSKHRVDKEDDAHDVDDPADEFAHQRPRRDMKRPSYAEPESDGEGDDAEELMEEMLHGDDADAMELDHDDEGGDDDRTPMAARPNAAVAAPFMQAPLASKSQPFGKPSASAAGERQSTVHMKEMSARPNEQAPAPAGQSKADKPFGDSGVGPMSLTAHAFSTRAGQAPQQPSTSRTGVSAPNTTQGQSAQGSQRGNKGKETVRDSQANEMEVDEPAINLADIEFAQRPLRMVHHRDLLVEEDKFSLRDQFTLVKEDMPVYQHGGQVMMLAPSGQQRGPFMVCDTTSCSYCSQLAAN
ncbi:hypothetical protein HII31_01688 [Pseudocercospora fuligena]|uniref:Uncharacterized protein n=1 Tax=Pseudocercospora fuligena TaxID=685502 RepID=A0A8H6RU84_9PEZI|nr:hypothetical protein HII31_01688 [Pseudocercospora fuligena]